MVMIASGADSVALAKWKSESSDIFNKFRGQMLQCAEAGMKPDTFITEEKGGYYIFFTPHVEVAYAVERIGREINHIAPGVLAYPGNVLHTTFTDYKVGSRYQPNLSSDHAQVIEAFDMIASRVADLMKSRAQPPAAKYGEVLFSLNTFILEGFSADSGHLDGALRVQEMGKELLGAELRMPWGSHISFGRVATEVSPAEVRKLIAFCGALTPLVADRAYPFASVDAGWYTISPVHGFQANVTSSYKL